MADELDIMNGALAKLGEEEVLSDPNADPPGRRLRVLQAHLPTVRDVIMRTHPWLSCQRRRLLMAMNTGASGDWKFAAAFRLPPQTLRVWSVETCAEWERGKAEEFAGGGAPLGVRDVIWANAQGPLRAVLIERVPYDEMDASLVEAITCELAARAAGPLQADKAMRKLMRDEAAEALAMGAAIETSEFGNQDPEFQSRWLAAR